MKVCAPIIASAFFFFAVTNFRADAIADAAKPMEQGVPEAAVAPLEKLASTLTGDEARAANKKLAQALIASAQYEKAWRVLEPLGNDADLSFLRGQALAGMGEYQRALEAYRQSASAGDCAFGVAEMLRALGNDSDAARAYEALRRDPVFSTPASLRAMELALNRGDAPRAREILSSISPKTTDEKRERRFLFGRLQLLEKRPDKASETVEKLAEASEKTPRATALASLFATADAHLQLGTPDIGDDFLEDFINRHGTDPDLGDVFAKLYQLYLAERKPSRSDLDLWARDSVQPRRSLAHWYLAELDVRNNRPDLAERHLAAIREAKPMPPAMAPHLLQWARRDLAANKPEEALAVLQEAKSVASSRQAEIDFEIGRALYAAQKFRSASEQFEQLTSTDLAAPALYNATLGWLRVSDAQHAAADAQKGDHAAAGDLMLEKALLAAAAQPKEAVAQLQDFIRQFPASPRISEAYLALAELAYHAMPPRLDAAARHLAAARQATPSPAVQEAIDYLALWLADARNVGDEKLIASANDFLRAYPASTHSEEVRMKLAEIHFRRQDFASAQTQFELVAQRDPKSALAEKALFFAAQSAARGMTPNAVDRALSLLAEVVKREGEFRWTARLEQAVIERQLGKTAEALLLYDDVLKGDASPAEKREALCGKGDVYLELAAADATNLPKALAAYDSLAATKEPHWRNQALFKKGVCLEKEADPDGALATFYQVLEPQPPTPKTPPEYFWYYKAGFNAARLLEEKARWQSAIAIYQKLVDANGPRSDEAKARLDQLRLEHFLWD
ncbi:MAG: tetratricopeptide repeat protein [Verrucomicrobiota bacterium]|nr:tetratricopeptide repeat protein [Verrucomicrobiota bacterium]